jgi:hypothetical protein
MSSQGNPGQLNNQVKRDSSATSPSAEASRSSCSLHTSPTSVDHSYWPQKTPAGNSANTDLSVSGASVLQTAGEQPLVLAQVRLMEFVTPSKFPRLTLLLSNNQVQNPGREHRLLSSDCNEKANVAMDCVDFAKRSNRTDHVATSKRGASDHFNVRHKHLLYLYSRLDI